MRVPYLLEKENGTPGSITVTPPKPRTFLERLLDPRRQTER